MISVNGIQIQPTIFPDRASQVWKLPETALTVTINGTFEVDWRFEHEGELIQLTQLLLLLHKTDKDAYKNLWIRTLPYARQDKKVSNDATFALHAFAFLLDCISFDEVFIVDPHNYKLTEQLLPNCTILRVENNIDWVYTETGSDNIVFPDHGASQRYELTYENPIIFDKVRDQATGEILGLKPIKGEVGEGKYLIVDDLCDAGKTFIECAKQLYLLGATEVYLYVSHGIFSKGTDVLFDAGIKRIFTYDGEVK